ncbi:MAG: hypothetical protein JXR55_01955 [Candidatus Fermentibacteraceae bacterium]|nr:hypothetical protein [Candidatus Fermentibacteraceae bacterium]
MRNSWYTRGFLVLTVLAVFTLSGTGLAREVRDVEMPRDAGTDARPPTVTILMNLANVWSAFFNLGIYGDPWENFPSCEWPGGQGSSYLWCGDFWGICYGPVTIHGDSTAKWASCSDYGDWELRPSEGFPAEKLQPGPVALEETHYGFDDWNITYNPNPFGMFVYTENYDWGTPGYNNFIAGDFRIQHFSDYGNPGVPLEGFMMAMRGDCDIATADPVDRNLDDNVYYDGHAIWCNDPNATFDYQFDDGDMGSNQDDYTYQQNPDNPLDPDDPQNIWYYYNYSGADGILDNDVDGNGVSDHFTILFKTMVATGDTVWLPPNSAGLVPFADGMPAHNWEQTVGDTVYHVVPRNMSYMYDSDSPSSGTDDSGEPGLVPPCNGYIGYRLLDLYIVKASGDIERPIDVYDYPIPISHSWWNWESDPGTDDERYNYMWGLNPDLSGRTSAPLYLGDWVGNPMTPDAYVADNPRPFPIVHDNPFNLNYPVFDYRFLISAGPVNLEDGDTLHVAGGWMVGLGLAGLRQDADDMLDAFYRDGGWGVPSLPPTPILFYSAGNGVVNLEWGANAESYDPLGGYNIYRSTFEPSSWELVHTEGPGVFGWTDHTVTNGFPYFYVVCSYDSETGVESTKSNYKQTIEGTPQPVTPVMGVDANWTENVTVVPNPYRGSAAWEQTYFDKIAFVNLPAMCNIYIYTLAGDHIITLEHRSPSGQEGTEFWDLISRNDQEVMSGLYVYRVETEDDFVIGKFAIIK